MIHRRRPVRSRSTPSRLRKDPTPDDIRNNVVPPNGEPRTQNPERSLIPPPPSHRTEEAMPIPSPQPDPSGGDPQDEHDLRRYAAMGDGEAFERLHRRHAAELSLLARRLTGSAADADD